MKIDRMLTIIVMLLNRNKVTAKELAEKFEVSIRTVYRDIETINMAGIPVISYPGNNGGFGIMENYKLNHQLLTLNNMCSILSALQGINNTLDDKEIESSIEKIKNLIPEEQNLHVEKFLEQVIIDILPWGEYPKHKHHVKIINEAINKNMLLTITYRNYSGIKNKRTIEPMSLVFKGFTWYLFAYCRLRSDYRLFRLSRIISLGAEPIPFTRKEKTYQEFEKESMQQIPVLKLILKFSPTVRTRVEDYFEKEAITELKDKKLLVRTELPDDEWLLSMILSFGEHIEVLEPLKVREKVCKKINEALKIYHT